MLGKLVVLSAVMLLMGCNGNGGSIPEMPPELMSALLASVGTADGSGGFVSPTCPHGFGQGHEDGEDIPEAHVPIMLVTRVGLGMFPEVRAFASSTAGATSLLVVANRYCCPISKACMEAGGWTIIEVEDPDGGHPAYVIEHSDGRRIGG